MQPHRPQFVLCPQPPKDRPLNLRGRQKAARAYWDSLGVSQEAWALKKMAFVAMGQRRSGRSYPSESD
jgi:hypothetical protein